MKSLFGYLLRASLNGSRTFGAGFFCCQERSPAAGARWRSRNRCSSLPSLGGKRDAFLTGPHADPCPTVARCFEEEHLQQSFPNNGSERSPLGKPQPTAVATADSVGISITYVPSRGDTYVLPLKQHRPR